MIWPALGIDGSNRVLNVVPSTADTIAQQGRDVLGGGNPFLCGFMPHVAGNSQVCDGCAILRTFVCQVFYRALPCGLMPRFAGDHLPYNKCVTLHTSASFWVWAGPLGCCWADFEVSAYFFII